MLFNLLFSYLPTLLSSYILFFFVLNVHEFAQTLGENLSIANVGSGSKLRQARLIGLGYTYAFLLNHRKHLGLTNTLALRVFLEAFIGL